MECRKHSGEERVAGKKLRCSSALVKAAEVHVSAFSPFRSFYATLALSAPECPYPEFFLSRLTRKPDFPSLVLPFFLPFLPVGCVVTYLNPLRGIKVAFRFNVKDGGTYGKTSYTKHQITGNMKMFVEIFLLGFHVGLVCLVFVD